MNHNNLRNDLIGEHRFSDAGQLLLACLFVVTWVVDTFILKYTTFLNHYVPNALRTPIGIVLLVVSGFLAGTGLVIVFALYIEA